MERLVIFWPEKKDLNGGPFWNITNWYENAKTIVILGPESTNIESLTSIYELEEASEPFTGQKEKIIYEDLEKDKKKRAKFGFPYHNTFKPERIARVDLKAPRKVEKETV